MKWNIHKWWIIRWSIQSRWNVFHSDSLLIQNRQRRTIQNIFFFGSILLMYLFTVFVGWYSVFIAVIMSYHVLLLSHPLRKKEIICAIAHIWEIRNGTCISITKNEVILHGLWSHFTMSNVYINNSRFDDTFSLWTFLLFAHQFSYEKRFSLKRYIIINEKKNSAIKLIEQAFKNIIHRFG